MKERIFVLLIAMMLLTAACGQKADCDGQDCTLHSKVLVGRQLSRLLLDS